MVANISPQEFAGQLRDGSAYIIDVRTPVEFREIHVEGAVNLPLDRFDPEAVRKRVPEGTTPYIICKSGGRGKMACEKALAAGWNDVVNVAGGTEACAAAGIPVHRGKRAISLERQVRITAGAIVLVASLLALFTDIRFAAISAFIGGGLVFAGVTDTCGMGMVLAKMPWNQVDEPACATK